jgi:hypothetical protein
MEEVTTELFPLNCQLDLNGTWNETSDFLAHIHYFVFPTSYINEYLYEVGNLIKIAYILREIP